MFRSYRHAFVFVPLFVSSILASPKIEFDTKTFNCGNVLEGKTEKLNAVFLVKNTGDSLLKLESVKPGCGCTVVKYDTLIQPGKSAKIESQVNIKGYRSGAISKSITVTSNAQNEPSVHLTIQATVQAIIECSESFLHLSSANIATPLTVHMASKKRDLKISGVTFKTSGNAQTPGWQSDIPLSIKFNFLPTDSIRTDGYRVFKLNVYSAPTEKPITGECIIKTNHPEKPEITLSAEMSK